MTGLRRAVLAAPAVLAAGYLLLLSAWAVANPPFAAPDEPDHYLRAVAIGQGALAGTPWVTVPSGLWTTDDPACNAHDPVSSAACVDALHVSGRELHVESRAGRYPPTAYVPAALAIRAASSPETALRVGRLATAASAGVLLAAAIVLVWQPGVGPLSLLGAVLAVTPMVLFVGSSLSTSAIEAAAGLAFGAALLRLARDGPAGRGVWIPLVATGTILTLTRSTGVLWLALGLVVFVSLTGLDGARARIRDGRPWATAAGAIFAGAFVANRAWQAAYGSEVTQTGPARSGTLDELGGGLEQLPRLAEEWVGIFGWLDSYLPEPAFRGWQLMLAVVVLAAFAVGTRRQRVTLVVALVAAGGVAVLFSATLRSGPFGGDVQARHLLPFLVVIPLLAGEIVSSRPLRLRAADVRVLTVGLVALAASIQVLAWYVNARRQAVGVEGPFLFLRRAEWAPPLGWGAWLATAVVGGCLIAAAAWLNGRGRPPARTHEMRT